MHPQYHTGMELQAPYTNLGLDGFAAPQYRIGMSEIRRLRIEAGVSQETLAKDIGTQQSQIARWEHPPTHPDFRRPSLRWAKALAARFRVSLYVIRPDFEDTKGSLDKLLKDEPPEIREQCYQAVVERLLQLNGASEQRQSEPPRRKRKK